MGPSPMHETRPAQLQVASIVIILVPCITRSLLYTRYVPAMVHHARYLLTKGTCMLSVQICMYMYSEYYHNSFSKTMVNFMCLAD